MEHYFPNILGCRGTAILQRWALEVQHFLGSQWLLNFNFVEKGEFLVGLMLTNWFIMCVICLEGKHEYCALPRPFCNHVYHMTVTWPLISVKKCKKDGWGDVVVMVTGQRKARHTLHLDVVAASTSCDVTEECYPRFTISRQALQQR